MNPSTGIWLLILTGIVILYSIYFFGTSTPAHRTLRDRLRSIVLPPADFTVSSLDEAARKLTELAEKNDTNGDGVLFTVEAASDTDIFGEPISIRFERSTLWDALEHLALLYGVIYHIDTESYSIIFGEMAESPTLLQRHYTLPPDHFPLSMASNDVLGFFKGHCLPLPDFDGMQSHIEYDPIDRVLSVTTVENTLNLMEKIFNLDPERTAKISKDRL